MKQCGFVSVDESRAITSQEMNARENNGVAIGISRLAMMENAGCAIARFAADSFSTKTNVLLVAGTGNNGGDAFVAARHLLYWENFGVTLALIGKETEIRKDEALTNWKILKKIQKASKIEIDSMEKIALFGKALGESQVIVSAIFGTGFRGKPRELHARIIKMINDSKATKVSVDIPSGMEADTGNYDIAVLSDYTITMDSPKIGMLANDKSRNACGKILVANIGVPL
ncbi:MAG: NAD(P)H-hydrate epimerase [Nitrososphaerales archaeon]